MQCFLSLICYMSIQMCPEAEILCLLVLHLKISLKSTDTQQILCFRTQILADWIA